MQRERARHLRVAAELQRTVNDLLQSEVKDPRLEGVRVSAAEVSGDLSVARLYYSTLNPDQDCGPVEQALEKAVGFLRGRVGRELRLRRAPELRFEHDRSAQRGFELSRLIEAQRSGSSDPTET